MFVHLRVHSEYSLVDSTVRLPELLASCAQQKMPAVAITDEGNLFGLVKFFSAAEKKGIKPLCGADVWVSSNGAPHRMTLLVQNETGYLHLSQLLSRGYASRTTHEFPVLDQAWLVEKNQGLIALSGGLFGEAGQHLVAHDAQAAEHALRLWDRLMPGRFYVELSRCGREHEAAVCDASIALAGKLGLPCVATNDVRFLQRSDFESHEARVCIHSGHVLNDPKRPRAYSEEQYLKSPAQMQALFADHPESLRNAVEIAKRCNYQLRTGKYFLPAFPAPKNIGLAEFLQQQAREGLAQRLITLTKLNSLAVTPEDYADRLQIEVDVINAMGFAGYFLIVADFIRWAKTHDVPVGPGRGSGAGSLVAYALGITDLDPLRYDLLFERFLNPERVSMPDFDIDFCMDKRDQVIRYVAQHYGRERVSQIITFGTMAAKACVRDCGRVLGMPYGQVDGIAKLIPLTLGISLEDALKEPDLKSRYDSEEDIRTLMDLALSLEGLTRNAGTHAGGVVIAPSALSDFSPLYNEAGTSNFVTQFDKDDVEAIGLVKFDFLGLRTLTIIDWAIKAINVDRLKADQTPLKIDELLLDDQATYELLQSGKTTAIFQLESRGMKELARKLKPQTFEEIIALGALFRPGPLQSGMVDEFVERKHGRRDVIYPHPLTEPVLSPTYGVIVYQEQVMQLAQVLAGYSLGGADLLRRAMGKKKPEEMAKQREIFQAGAKSNGLDPAMARSVFDLMEKFAEYGFNKSHSAAYAMVTYQTAWLKTHYPAHFMAAVLSSDMDNTDKVVDFITDTIAFKLTLMPPDINQSWFNFRAIDQRTIRYGLGAIKGVGQHVCEMIAAERERGGPFLSLKAFCARLDLSKLNKRVLESLIYSGSMDKLNANRAELLHQLPDAVKAAEQLTRDMHAGQVDLFGGATAPVDPTNHPEQALADLSLEEKLKGERATLGWYLSGHPMDEFAHLLEPIIGTHLGGLASRVSTAPVRRGAEPVLVLAGSVVSVRKRGEGACFVQIEDSRGRLEIALYRDAIGQYFKLLEKDRIIVVEGSCTTDEYSGGYQMRLKKAWSLSDAMAQFCRSVQLDTGALTSNFAQQLHATIKPFIKIDGGAQLRLRMTHVAGTSFELEFPQWRLQASLELRSALEKLPGVRSVGLALSRQGVNAYELVEPDEHDLAQMGLLDA
jgi:DNA polymerase III subunit alpha